MTYDETIKYLYDSAPMFQKVGTAAYKEGMENAFLIDKHLHYPHTKYKTIHVAGTNGKGSTCHLLASVLQEAGYKTGLYTSPHLLDFRERIKVNGEMIDKDYVVRFIAENKDFFESIQPSFFELTTGMALAYFAEQAVDVAVIEVGLGGRLDSTNVITPVLSIITNISFDHTHLLGNTLAAIAKEKAGIIKSGVPVVIGEAEGEVRDVFEGERRKVQGERQKAKGERQKAKGERQKVQGERFVFVGDEKLSGYEKVVSPLQGFAQEKNTATVLCAINILNSLSPFTFHPSPFTLHPSPFTFHPSPFTLHLSPFTFHLSPFTLHPSPFTFHLSPEAVRKGFENVIKNTGLMGRWQIVGEHPKIVLDTGHNAGGMMYNVRQLQSEKYDVLHIVFGMVNDKDISAVLQLLPKDAKYYFTQANLPRALDAQILAEQAGQFGLKGEVFHQVSDAFSAAKKNAGANDFIFVGGSTFVVAEVLEL